MNRRHFLQQTSRAALAAPFLRLPHFLKGVSMGIVVHSYGSRWNSKIESKKYPGFRDAIDLLEHCHSIGAGGIQVVVRNWASDFTSKVRDKREELNMFLEGSISLPSDGSDVARFEKDILTAREAGATIVRTVCLNGRRYENFHSLDEYVAFKERSNISLRLAEPIVRKHKVRLAIENHKDWRAPELADIMKKISSEWIGVTLDFGNNVALIEDPMEVVNTLAPYIFSTHVKDMGVREYDEGFLLSEVPLGEGMLDLKQICDICRKHRPDVHFNLEMITRDPLKIPCLLDSFWQTFPAAEPEELARTLRLVREHPFRPSLPVVSTLEPEARLEAEEQNVLASLQYSKTDLGMD